MKERKEKKVIARIPVDVYQKEANQEVVDEFHELFYPLHFSTTWMGFQLMKNPLDLAIYQEIIYECKPDLIVECGTAFGGSALYLAHLCDILNHGQVVTIDVSKWVGVPIHPRITYYTGSSTAEKTITDIKNFANGFRKVMVILDSDHAMEHVYKELESYSKMVTPGQYMIVEDSNVHGHPVNKEHPVGPFEAVQKWIPKHEEFYIDKACERYLVTFNPNGYLRRVK
jgi:cephalosporin hydroxylase